MEISRWEEPDFFSLASTLAHEVSLGSYHILMRKNFDPLWSKLSHKQPPQLDILGGHLRETPLYYVDILYEHFVIY